MIQISLADSRGPLVSPPFQPFFTFPPPVLCLELVFLDVIPPTTSSSFVFSSPTPIPLPVNPPVNPPDRPSDSDPIFEPPATACAFFRPPECLYS